jgi:uncharacterized membrane protein
MRKMAAATPSAKAVSGPIFRASMLGQTYMDAVITPHRSLSDRGFIVLIAVVTVCNCISSAVFVYYGATLVPVFMAFDVLAVIVAFAVSFAGAKRIERVTITARDVVVTHEAPNWTKVVWESPTAFTRVAVEKDEDRTVGLRLAISGKDVAVAQALSPGERADFARALEQAIWEARRERG